MVFDSSDGLLNKTGLNCSGPFDRHGTPLSSRLKHTYFCLGLIMVNSHRLSTSKSKSAQSFLFQIGYEPVAPVQTTSIFGRQVLCYPNLFKYCKWLLKRGKWSFTILNVSIFCSFLSRCIKWSIIMGCTDELSKFLLNSLGYYFTVGHVRRTDGFLGMYRGCGSRILAGFVASTVSGHVSTVSSKTQGPYFYTPHQRRV